MCKRVCANASAYMRITVCFIVSIEFFLRTDYFSEHVRQKANLQVEKVVSPRYCLVS